MVLPVLILGSLILINCLGTENVDHFIINLIVSFFDVVLPWIKLIFQRVKMTSQNVLLAYLHLGFLLYDLFPRL